MKAQRLLKMTPAELAFRGRQQVTKVVERLVAPRGAPPPPCRFDRRTCSASLWQIASRLESADAEVAALELQAAFEHLLPPRFFAGASDSAVEHGISAFCAADRQKIIERADAICRDEFDILGYGSLSFGTPVNWQLDAVSGLEAAPEHWSRINHLASKQVGDSKVVFELNRHQWLLDLGQAYRFTGNADYAETFVRLIRHWMQQNPPGFGINWTSSLEVAMRLISWCWALFLFRGSEALSPRIFVQMLGWLQAHARYVERYLSNYYSPNTHLTGEALGLYYAGVLFPELQGAERWRALAHQLLVTQMEFQVHPGGVYFEQSTRYQYYTVEIYLHYILLAERNGEVVPELVWKRLEEMVEFLLHVRRPDGTLPQIGDTDGGWLLPLVRREPGDCQALFSTAGVLFQNSHFAWAAGKLAAETLWFFGTPAQRRWMSLMRVPPGQEQLRTFREGGYVVMRSGWTNHSHQLIFDTGPLGCRVSGAHGHADLLSIQCSAWGEPFLVDAGTFCYTAEARWRNYFRSSEAHSTVLVDGCSQAEPNGPFSWRARPAARLRQCLSEPGFCLADAEHNAYESLADAVTHRRRVLFVDSRYWLVIDDLSGSEKHRIDVRFQFAPMPVETENDGWVRARGTHGSLLLKAFSGVALEVRIQQGEMTPALGWISPNYGQRIPAPALTFSTESQLPLRIVTLVFPQQGTGVAVPDVSASIQQSTVTGITVNAEREEFICIDEEDVFVPVSPRSAYVRN